MTVSVLSPREAATARRVWRARWLDTLDDLEAVTLDRGGLYADVGRSLLADGRDGADRWWTP